MKNNLKKYIMSIDQGTTGSTVVLMNQSGRLVSKATVEYRQIYPQPGWVEHSPEEIWQSVQNAALECLKKIGASQNEIITIGITNQRETVVAFRKSTGEILHNAIVWQCRRTTKMCEQLRKKWSIKIKNKTGLVLDPYFSATKMRWLIENAPAVKKALDEKDLAFGTIDTFLMWKLSEHKIFATDVTNASRTMLMNLKTATWDTELMKLFKVPLECLPEIRPSSGLFGSTAQLNFVDAETPISGVAGDQQAALFGQVCFSEGESKCTFGTGSFILMNTGSKILKSKAGCLTTVAWKLGNGKIQYALEGGAFICGAAVGWLRDGLGLIEKSSEVEALARQVNSSEGVEFVPALTGLGAPYWNAEARGEITGLTRGSTKAHIARATLEAMALQNADILFAMQKDLKKKMKRLRVDGGAAANDLLMQLQADYLQTSVDRPVQIETTAIGAAYLAGLGIGHWKNLDDIKSIWKKESEFSPNQSLKSVNKRKESWKRAVRKAQITA
jgi:glycerol kinase